MKNMKNKIEFKCCYIFIIAPIVVVRIGCRSKLSIGTREIQVSNNHAPTLRIVVRLDRK